MNDVHMETSELHTLLLHQTMMESGRFALLPESSPEPLG
jgi:hypothetical protein